MIFQTCACAAFIVCPSYGFPCTASTPTTQLFFDVVTTRDLATKLVFLVRLSLRDAFNFRRVHAVDLVLVFSWTVVSTLTRLISLGFKALSSFAASIVSPSSFSIPLAPIRCLHFTSEVGSHGSSCTKNSIPQKYCQYGFSTKPFDHTLVASDRTDASSNAALPSSVSPTQAVPHSQHRTHRASRSRVFQSIASANT